jgi:hypothetical protein
VGLIGSAAAVIAAAVLGVAGFRTLADSTAGQDAADQAVPVQSQRHPNTATALVATVDEDDRITSVAVLLLETDGTGGTVVPLVASADADSGTTGVLRPLHAVFEADGPAGFLSAAETLTGLSFDVVELVDQRRFADIVGPLGELTADLPTPLRDASSGEEWPAGEILMTGAGAARAITAADPSISDWFLDPSRQAIWRAVTDRVGAGIGSAAPVAQDGDLPVPSTLDEFVDRLFASAVAFRPLSFRTIVDARVSNQVPLEYAAAFGPDNVPAVAVHDPAEVLIVFGSLAPARLGAPLDALMFRIIGDFGPDRLQSLGMDATDVMKIAVDRLLFVKVNVVSVRMLPGEPIPEVTQFKVADPEIIEAVEEEFETLFGPIEVSAADVTIDGVDIEIILGESYLDQIAD